MPTTATAPISSGSALDGGAALAVAVPQVAKLTLDADTTERLGMVGSRSKNPLKGDIFVLAVNAHRNVLTVIVDG